MYRMVGSSGYQPIGRVVRRMGGSAGESACVQAATASSPKRRSVNILAAMNRAPRERPVDVGETADRVLLGPCADCVVVKGDLVHGDFRRGRGAVGRRAGIRVEIAAAARVKPGNLD